MKKLVSLLCTCVCSLALAIPALAEPVSVTTINARNASLNEKNNLIYYSAPDSIYYRLIDQDGNEIASDGDGYIEMQAASGYKDFFTVTVNYSINRNGVKVVSEDDIHKKGVIDCQGNVILPPEYAKIEYISSRWQAGLKFTPSSSDDNDYTVTNYTTNEKSFYRIASVDFYCDGEKAGTLSREEYGDNLCMAYGAYVKVKNREGKSVYYDRHMQPSPLDSDQLSGEFTSEYKNGKTFNYHNGSGQQVYVDTCTLDPADLENPYHYDKGVVYDIQGKEVFHTAQNYDSVRKFIDGYALAVMNRLYGIIDLEGNEVIPLEYESLGYSSGEFSYGYISAVKDGKFGFLDAKGNVTCEFKYPENVVKNRGTFAFLTDLDGSTIVLSAAVGELPEHYTEVSFPSTYGSRAFLAKNSEGQRGIIDIYGNTLLPFTDDYNYMYLSNDGTVALASRGSRQYDIMTFEIPDPETAAAEGADAEKDQPADTEENADASAKDGWTCENGHAGNTGKFCTECGAPKPAQEAQEEDGWTCVNGHAGNTGKFCTECGSPKP